MRKNKISKPTSDEPIWDREKGEEQLPSILNWFSNNKSFDDSHKYLIEYLENTQNNEDSIKHIKKLPSWKVGSYGWLARLTLTSQHLPNKLKTKLDNKIKDLLSLDLDSVESKFNRTKIVDKSLDKKPTVQENIELQLRKYLGECEGWIDSFCQNGYKTNFIPFDWFKENNIKSIQMKNIADHFKKTTLVELNAVLEQKDEQLVEAYSHIKKSDLKKLISFIELIVEDAIKWHDISKQISDINKKPRQKKPKPPIKQVQKLNYLKQHENLESISPVKIVGAEQLWVFNTKTRVLGVYVCNNSHGFVVKGSTIQNFDAAASISKKLRKPDEIINKVLSDGKVALKKILPNIKAKEKRLTGRINKDTILLRVL